MTEKLTLDERVCRGAILLDERASAGWRDRVRGAGRRFRMEDHAWCVAALALGETFFKAMRVLGFNPYARSSGEEDDQVYLAAFDVSDAQAGRVNDGEDDETRLYDELRDAWLRYLETCTAEDVGP